MAPGAVGAGRRGGRGGRHYDGRKWTETSVAGLFPPSTGGHRWSLAAAGQSVLGPLSLASDGKGGLWMTSDIHENYQVLLHYSAGQLVNANEPFMSVASIPGTAVALGGNASPVATMPTIYQYS